MSLGDLFIDCYETGYRGPWEEQAVVAVDVIRATTTAVTSVAMGRRCFPAPSLEAAVSLAARLEQPLLVGELGGNMPFGFHLTNSPALVAERQDVERPMLLLSTSGTTLIGAARGARAVYAACLRNYRAQAEHLVGRYDHIALIGAGSRREFREEDQLCCAWIADLLVDAGYEPRGRTAEFIARWGGRSVESILVSTSARYLESTGQQRDLDFILGHVDDLELVARLETGELVSHPAAAASILAGHHSDNGRADRGAHR
ncbi:MAG: 2-phosphosulfolactate phosphatase [Chloroflexi bacterium]|nr:2-phosphosulfolactate phosphatase [Chloroflexota bacterium]